MKFDHFLSTRLESLEQLLDVIKLDAINVVDGILSGKNHIAHDLLPRKNASANIDLWITLHGALLVNPQSNTLTRNRNSLYIVAIHVFVHIGQSVVTLADVNHGAWEVEVCGDEEDGDDGGGVLHVGIVT